MSFRAPIEKNVELSGNFLLFYAYDLGDEINLERLKKSHVLTTHIAPLSACFKNYHIPLSFNLADCNPEVSYRSRTDCVSSKIHSFGVISLCYKIPFMCNFEELKNRFIEITQIYNEKCEEDIDNLFRMIKPFVARPHLYNINGKYSAVQVEPLETMSPAEFKDAFGPKIASLMRHEKETLSESQKTAILSSTTAYYGQDMVIIDGEAAFIYDNEYFEIIEFLESANIQRLELNYFDRLLDHKLNSFYNSDSAYKIPLLSYVPLLKSKEDRLVEELARLRVDISVIVERLEISIKMSGEPYHEEIYSILVDKLLIQEWQASVNKKLSIVEDLYSVHRDRLSNIREEMLTVVIVLLITFEAYVAFLRIGGH